MQGQRLNPTESNNIGEYLGAGHSERNTADILGVSRSSVQRYRKDPAIKAIIEEGQDKLAKESAMNIIDTDIAVISKAHKVLAVDEYDQEAITLFRDTGLMDLYTKVSKRVGQAIGIFNTPTPSIFIQNLYQDNRSQTIAPGVLALISGGLTDPGDDEAIEGDYEIIE